MRNATLEFKLKVSASIGEVSCIWNKVEQSTDLLILAHGAGAGMHHSFMERLSEALSDHQISTLRFQFPYLEQGKKRPDRPEIAHQTIQTVYNEAKNLCSGCAVFLGGKSYGGRMSSQTVALNLVDQIGGIVFYGFPLHPPGKISMERADHLFKIQQHMLFCQGTRDKLAEITLMKSLHEKLGENASLYVIEGGDHSFAVPKSTHKNQDDIIRDLGRQTRQWMNSL